MMNEDWLLITDDWLLITDDWLLMIDCWWLIVDDWLLINDVVQTENIEGNGGLQSDWMGERELQQIVRELKKIINIHRCHRWTQMDVRRRTEDKWLMIID